MSRLLHLPGGQALVIVPDPPAPPVKREWPVSPIVPKLEPDKLTKEQAQTLVRRYVGRHGSVVWKTSDGMRVWYGLLAFVRTFWSRA